MAGTVEEITLTYVVVRIWDDRRYVVPITYFLEQPFQNWTKVSTELSGPVMIYADYGVPIETLRQEQTRFLENHRLWDRRMNVLQVSSLRSDTVELRALVSARNAGDLWDLQCALRELEGGRYLPRQRVEQPRPSDGAVLVPTGDGGTS